MSKNLGVHRKLVSAKEISKLADISYATINNYTDMGLLDIVAKQNRVRLYDLKHTKERLAVIARLINEGYTLRVIVKLLK